MKSDLIKRLEGHIETLRWVASSVYSDDIKEAVDALEQKDKRIAELQDEIKVMHNHYDPVVDTAREYIDKFESDVLAFDIHLFYQKFVVAVDEDTT